MTAIDITWVVLAVLAWTGLLAVRAVRPQHSSLSSAELARRVKGGDQVAGYEVWRSGLLGRVHGLKHLLEGFLVVVLVLLLVHLLGVGIGGVVAFVALVIVDGFAEVTRISARINRLYTSREPGLLKKIEGLAWLGWFAVPEKARSMRIGSRAELAELVEHISPQILPRDDRTTLLAELDFADKKVADVMTPKSMIDSVALDETIGPLLLDRLHHTGHSRFPVIEGDVDHVVGMLYLHELIGTKGAPTSVKKALHDEVYYIGEGRDLEHALHAFLQSHHHLFIVVNEYRETVGLLSLEDIIEALIGRSIIDEFDAFDDLRTVATTNPKSNNAPKGQKDI
jgi:CBS domain containing-hemolysin-like protein